MATGYSRLYFRAERNALYLKASWAVHVFWYRYNILVLSLDTLKEKRMQVSIIEGDVCYTTPTAPLSYIDIRQPKKVFGTSAECLNKDPPTPHPPPLGHHHPADPFAPRSKCFNSRPEKDSPRSRYPQVLDPSILSHAGYDSCFTPSRFLVLPFAPTAVPFMSTALT